MPGSFVDVHSHVVPSGDDGARTVEDGLALCREAARRGTGVLFATPHVWPRDGLSREREEAVRAAHADMAGRAGLELLLGWELTPAPALLGEDLRRYRLGDLDAALMELPFHGSLDLAVAVAERLEAAGLRPVIAHPERAEAIVAEPRLGEELAARGWLLQLNASSLLGHHGPERELTAWLLLEGGSAALVASDGHRPARPPHLDGAYALVSARVGEGAARPLFDGSPLGLRARDGVDLAQRR